MPQLSDPQQVETLGKKAKLRRDQELRDVSAILDLEHGRRFVWRYLEEAGIFKTSFTGNSTTFFNEGRREIGLKMLADVMQASPDSYIKMAKEAEVRKQAED